MEKKTDTQIGSNDTVKRIMLEMLADGNTYPSCSIEKKAGLVLTRCKEELEKCCVVNMLDIEEGEMDTIKKVGSTIKALEKEVEKYEVQDRKEEKHGKISGQEKVK